MRIEHETAAAIDGLTVAGFALGIGLTLGSGFTGVPAYEKAEELREACQTQGQCGNENLIDAYQESGDAATPYFWSGLGIVAVSAAMRTFNKKAAKI